MLSHSPIPVCQVAEQLWPILHNDSLASMEKFEAGVVKGKKGTSLHPARALGRKFPGRSKQDIALARPGQRCSW